MKSLCTAASMMLLSLSPVMARDKFEQDIFKTAGGDLRITFIGHGTLMLAIGGKIIHVDPLSGEADYSKLPKADIILITHEHGDHFDPKAIELIATGKTLLLLTEPCAAKIKGGMVMKNGDAITVSGVQIEAVCAYNIKHMRAEGQPFHPKGIGNGYVLTIGDKRVYIAGDTENIPEMKNLKGIDVAFLPMNLPYTMTPEMAAAGARSFSPRVLYPYHFGDTDTSKLVNLLQGSGIEVRIRSMK